MTTLRPDDPTAHPFWLLGVHRFDQACDLVHQLPYGRAVDVLGEGRGTCSSKHALLAALGQAYGVDVQLMVGLFDMGAISHPALGPVLLAAGLETVPEAHCYLRLDGHDVDLTFPGPVGHPPAMREVTAWAPHRIGEKTQWHRERIGVWAEVHGRSADEVWAVREACIAVLSDGDSSQ